MKAVRLDQLGSPENLKLVDRPRPSLGETDILIEVAQAGIIYADGEARRGTYYVETELPWYPGREAAGVIVETGQNVDGFKPGDRVVAIVHGGGCYAEYVLAPTVGMVAQDGRYRPAAMLHKLPDHVSYGQALVYVINYRLAHILFHCWSGVPKGETILIHGICGGMGTMLAEIGREHGCRVLGTCRTEHEQTYAQSIGADCAINVTLDDYVERCRELTSDNGLNYIFNGVGGETIMRDIELVAAFGEIVAYGYVAGKIDFDLLGVTKTVSFKTFNADDVVSTNLMRDATDAMLRRFDAGNLLEPGETLPITDVAQAHRHLDEGRILGKVCLEVRSNGSNRSAKRV